MSNTNQDLLLKIYEELKETKEKVQDIPEMKKQLEEIPKMKKQLGEIPKMKKQLEEIPKMKKQLEEIPKMQDEILEIKKILKEIPEMKQELRKISGSVARIEVEHGEKLVALFDAFKMNTEKIQEQDGRITKCEKTLEKHDDQIYMLNSKIKNA